MNLAFSQLRNLGGIGRSASQPYIPSSPIMYQDNEDSFSKDRYWLVSGNVSSPMKPSRTGSSRADVGIPVEFNSRAAKNMLYSEKINYWLQNIPWFQTDHNVWMLDCYPGIVSSSSSSNELESICDEDQDKVEYQCRQVTKLVTRQYYTESQDVARPCTSTSANATESEIVYTEDEYLFGEVTAGYV